MTDYTQKRKQLEWTANRKLEHGTTLHNTHATIAGLNVSQTKQLTGADKHQESSRLKKVGIALTIAPDPTFIADTLGIPLILAGMLKDRMDGNGQLSTRSVHAHMNRLIKDLKAIRE